MQYRRKTSPSVEAMKFLGTDISKKEIDNWSNGRAVVDSDMSDNGVCHYLVIKTIEGNAKAIRNDWVIQDRGSFYLCKDESFNRMYETDENAGKPKVRIENWRFDGTFLSGQLYGHPGYKNGEFADVQGIKSFDPDNQTMETKHVVFALGSAKRIG